MVISGYSIGSSIDTKEVGFYRRRAIRILPLYVLAILLSYALHFIPNSNSLFEYPSLNLTICNLFLFQGFACKSLGTNPVVWTLSIEVLFYILSPFLIYLIRQNTVYGIIWLSTSLFCTYKILSKYFFPQMLSFHELLFDLGPILLAWAWLLGFYFYFEKNKKVAFQFLLAGTLSVSVLYSKNLTGLAIYLITCLAIIYGSKLKFSKEVCMVFSALGDYSYPL